MTSVNGKWLTMGMIGSIMNEARKPTRPHAGFPKAAVAALLVLCIVPVLTLFSIEALLGRNCITESTDDGVAGGNLLWRIETQRCGNGPLVTNVLLAPRGKSFALVASSTGTPRPVSVERNTDGTTLLKLDSPTASGFATHALVLKSTGRPARPLVLANGQPKS